MARLRDHGCALGREEECSGHRVGVDPDGVARRELALEQSPGQRILDEPLDRPLERARPEGGIRAFLHDQLSGGRGQVDRQVLLGQPAIQPAQEQLDDLFEIGLRQRVEDDDLVDPVQELGPELGPERIGDLALHRLVGAVVLTASGAADGADQLRPDVARQDDRCVPEVDGWALAIGQAAIVEDLEEEIEDIRVGLLDLIEEDHLVRPAADHLGQLPALLIAGRRPDQTRDGELLHVLAHVDPSHRLVVIEQELREGARQLGLPDARRAEEEERAERPARVAKTGPGAPDGIGHGLDRFILADDPLVETILHLHELLELAFHQPGDRNSGPGGDDLGDVVCGDLLA